MSLPLRNTLGVIHSLLIRKLATTLGQHGAMDCLFNRSRDGAACKCSLSQSQKRVTRRDRPRLGIARESMTYIHTHTQRQGVVSQLVHTPVF